MTRTTSRGKKRISIVIASLFIILGIGAAYAYWTSTGTGTGTAQTGTSEALEITSEAAVGTIVPDGPGQTIDFTVTNPSEGSLYLTGVTVEMATAPGMPWVPTGDCSIDDYTAAITTAPTAGDIPSLGTVDNGVATVTLESTGVNQDDCKGQEVPLLFTAS
ncbi:hypothetical protein [Arthrobacter sp. 260]|uniref:hypothetical protein n=1 Tax=Arthrobacter sp. 260 TaxID=2735314 RepID=UPI001493169C|nr:hypothetical protein [Arthrobacter sp. 260]NOJ59854.1 hypothetical protein [Arthrobacter sp. 260]